MLFKEGGYGQKKSWQSDELTKTGIASSPKLNPLHSRMDSGRPTAALICLSDACRASISFRRSSGDLEAHKCGGEQIHLAADSARFHHYERVLHGAAGRASSFCSLLIYCSRTRNSQRRRRRQGEKTTHLNKKWVPVSYSAVRDFGRINFFVV